ncbi:MAG: hypothetical protein ABSC95_10200 [Acetobacteraceae bacterium]
MAIAWLGVSADCHNRRENRRIASGTSQQDLKERIERFIAYFNLTMAKPFEWTKTGSR